MQRMSNKNNKALIIENQEKLMQEINTQVKLQAILI